MNSLVLLLVLPVLQAPVALQPGAFAPSSGLLEDSCPLPPELENVRGHILFEYVLSPAGALQGLEVRYASVEPPDSREPFLSALSRCALEKARQGGAPAQRAEESPRWISMHYFSSAPRWSPLAVRPDGIKIPLTWIAEMRDEKIRLAETIFTGTMEGRTSTSSYHEIQGSGWTLKTNLSDATDRLALHDGLRFAGKAFQAAFPEAPPVPGTTPLTILFFERQEELRLMEVFDTLISEPLGLAGKYTSLDRMIYAAKGRQPRHLMARLMAHEAAHHRVSYSFYAGRSRELTWVNEGIATFIECLRAPEGDDIDLAAFDRGEREVDGVLWPYPASSYLEELHGAGLAGNLPSLADFLNGRLKQRFHSKDAHLHYGMAWIVVHYLLNAEEGKHREAFRTWLGHPREQAAASLAWAVGKPIEQLQKAIVSHIGELRASTAPVSTPARDPEGSGAPSRNSQTTD